MIRQGPGDSKLSRKGPRTLGGGLLGSHILQTYAWPVSVSPWKLIGCKETEDRHSLCSLGLLAAW